jgi:hypothetical protein
LDGRELLGMSSKHEIWLCMAKGVLKKKSWDLARLIEVPEASLKSERMVFNLEASCAVGVPINMVSSTNWLCEVVG